MFNILILTLVMIVGALILLWIIKKPENMIIIMLLNYLKFIFVYLFTGSTDIVMFSIGGIQVYINDLITLLMLFTILLPVKNKIVNNKGNSNFMEKSTVLLVIYVLVIVGFSLARGLIENSFNSALISDTRTFGYFFVAVVYFIVFIKRIYQEKEKVEKKITFTMHFFLVFSIIMWSLDLIFGINSFAGQINGTLSDGGTTMRIAHPEVVFFLAVYTCYLVYKDLSTNINQRYIRPLTILFIFAVILHQQRTVWISFLVGILCVFYILYKEKKYISKLLFFEIFIIVIVSTFIVLSSSNNIIFDNITNGINSLGSIASDTGTFGTRTGVWRSLINSLSGVDYIIGQSFGSGYSGDIGWAYTPHNGIVQWIMRSGYLGLAILVMLMINILLLSKINKFYIPVLIIFMCLTYWLGYGFTMEQGVLIGCCIGFLIKIKNNYRIYGR